MTAALSAFETIRVEYIIPTGDFSVISDWLITCDARHFDYDEIFLAINWLNKTGRFVLVPKWNPTVVISTVDRPF
jgi:hypothetical protein